VKEHMPIFRPDHRWYAWLISITRVVASFLGAGLFNLIWLAAFLTFAGRPPRGPVSWLLWCLAPPITALGFSYGIILFDYSVSHTRHSLLSVLPLLLVGCVIGAVVIFPIGQMFIGFGIFVFGGMAVLLQEVRRSRKDSGGA
jgi:hypothetical protein